MEAEPLTPLTKVLSIGRLLEEAAKALPEMAEDGITLGVHLTQSDIGFVGVVRIKDVTGKVIGTFSREGEKSLLGVIDWKF